MINVTHSLLMVAVTAIVTLLLRAIPFMIFRDGKAMPAGIKKVADLLPAAIIAVLVIYCIKGDIAVISMNSLATLIALLGVICMHLWKRNTLLSIAVGTVLYMALIRLFPLI